MRNACAVVETVRETQVVYQVWCEDHRLVFRTKDYTEAEDRRFAHNEAHHLWALGITEDTNGDL